MNMHIQYVLYMLKFILVLGNSSLTNKNPNLRTSSQQSFGNLHLMRMTMISSIDLDSFWYTNIYLLRSFIVGHPHHFSVELDQGFVFQNEYRFLKKVGPHLSSDQTAFIPLHCYLKHVNDSLYYLTFSQSICKSTSSVISPHQICCVVISSRGETLKNACWHFTTEI